MVFFSYAYHYFLAASEKMATFVRNKNRATIRAGVLGQADRAGEQVGKQVGKQAGSRSESRPENKPVNRPENRLVNRLVNRLES